jgi:murein DD-endopeptidase MepM/ murein hydrolase activator NlpD
MSYRQGPSHGSSQGSAPGAHGSYDHRRDSGRQADSWAYEYPRTAQPQAAAPRHHHPEPRRRRTDYTLTHAGRQVRLGPIAFWIVVGSLVVMAGWSVVTGTYFAFHDDVIKRVIARQAEMQFAYEDRIAELRAQVDRITSRQLLDQEQFEQKLDTIARKQAVLETRAATISSIGADPVTTGSVKPAQRPNIFDRSSAPKPSPINDTVIYTPPPDREARLESRASPTTLAALGGKRMRGGVDGSLLRMQDALDRLEAQQSATLSAIEDSYDSRTRRIRGVLSDLGIDTGKPPSPSSPPPADKKTASAGVGGPYVAASLNADGTSFERQVYRISLARAYSDKLNKTLAAVPVRKPVFGEIDMSSPFGMRMDPFLKGPAIHTGVDMRGDSGDPVRVTANGTVTIAGVNGGYGKMVEVDHGNGLATRYGHLSAIDVNVGQTVKIGQIIGKIGSTGRSTGPHLHYETRVDGEAVDPQKYLRAGLRLGTAN